MSSSSSAHLSSNSTAFTPDEKKQTEQQKLDAAYKIWKTYMDRLDVDLPQPRPMEEFMKYLSPLQKVICWLVDPAVQIEGLKRIAELCEQHINVEADKKITRNDVSCLEATNEGYAILIFDHGQIQFLSKLTSASILTSRLTNPSLSFQATTATCFEEINNFFILKFLGKSHMKPVSYAECFHFDLRREGYQPYRRETVVKNLFARLEKALITDTHSQMTITPLSFLQQLAIELVTICQIEHLAYQKIKCRNSDGYADDAEATYFLTLQFIEILHTKFLEGHISPTKYRELKRKPELSDFFKMAEWEEKDRTDYLQKPVKLMTSEEKRESKSASSPKLFRFQTAYAIWQQYPSSVDQWNLVVAAAEAVNDTAVKIICLALIASEYEANRPPYSYSEYFPSSKSNARKALDVYAELVFKYNDTNSILKVAALSAQIKTTYLDQIYHSEINNLLIRRFLNEKLVKPVDYGNFKEFPLCFKDDDSNYEEHPFDRKKMTDDLFKRLETTLFCTKKENQTLLEFLIEAGVELAKLFKESYKATYNTRNARTKTHYQVEADGRLIREYIRALNGYFQSFLNPTNYENLRNNPALKEFFEIGLPYRKWEATLIKSELKQKTSLSSISSTRLTDASQILFPSSASTTAALSSSASPVVSDEKKEDSAQDVRTMGRNPGN